MENSVGNARRIARLQKGADAKKPPKGSDIRSRRRRELEEEIREVAFRHYLEFGYDGLTLKNVCEEVGISLRTIFRYFRTKDDILSYPIRHRVDALLRFIQAQPAEESVVTAYTNATLAMLEDDNYDPEEAHLIQQVLRDVPSLRARYVIHFGDNAQDEMEAEFAKRMGVPISNPRVHLLRTFIVTAAVSAMITWSKNPDDYDLRELSVEFLDLLKGAEEMIRSHHNPDEDGTNTRVDT